MDGGHEQCEPLLFPAGQLFEPFAQFFAKPDVAHALADLLTLEFHSVQAAVESCNLFNAQFAWKLDDCSCTPRRPLASNYLSTGSALGCAVPSWEELAYV